MGCSTWKAEAVGSVSCRERWAGALAPAWGPVFRIAERLFHRGQRELQLLRRESLTGLGVGFSA